MGPSRSPRGSRGIWLGLGGGILVAAAGIYFWGSVRPEGARVADGSGAPARVPAATSRIQAEPVPETEDVGSTPSSPRWVLQAASYRTRRRAQEVLSALHAATGLEGVVLISDVNGERWYRILLGPFPEREAADRARESVRATRLVGEMLLRPAPPGWDAALGPDRR